MNGYHLIDQPQAALIDHGAKIDTEGPTKANARYSDIVRRDTDALLDRQKAYIEQNCHYPPVKAAALELLEGFRQQERGRGR